MAAMAFRHRHARPGLPDGWEDLLEARSAQWRLLEEPDRARLGELADWFLRTKRVEAARGFELSDEVRTVLAGHACLLILGLDESWYDAVGTIIVRSGSMTQRANSAGPISGTVNGEPMDVDGVRTMTVGTIIWGVIAVALLPFLGSLDKNNHTWWLWTAVAGFGLGLIGIEYCRRRRNALRMQPGRRRRVD